MGIFEDILLTEKKSKKRNVRKGRGSKKSRKMKFSKKAQSLLPNIVKKIAKGKK